MTNTVPTINRMAAVVEARGPYLHWARNLDDDGPTIDSLSRQDLTSVYLFEEDDNTEAILQRHWAWIFEEKLDSWHRDPEAWPRERTYEKFREWFDVRLIDLVHDLADGPIEHEE